MAEQVQPKDYAASFTIKSAAIWKVGEENGKPYANLGSMIPGSMLQQFQYHEDINWPSYGGTMVIVDNEENLISTMPIQGWEKVVIDIEDNNGGQYVYEFRVWNVFNRVNNDRKQTYTLGLISEYGLLNEGIRINKKIEGNTSLQVVKLLKEYLKVPEELIDSEESSTTIKILPTKKTPYSLIRSLLPKTISEKTGNAIKERQASYSGLNNTTSDVNTVEAEKATGTAGYFFFQTIRGFTFRSIDSLVSTDETFNGNPPIGKPFIYNWTTEQEPSLYRIQEVVFGQELNMLKKMRTGGYSSLTCYLNINTGQYEEQVFSLAEMWSDMAHLGNQPKLPFGQEQLAKYPSRIMSAVINHENWYMGTKVASNEPQHGGGGDNSFPDFQKQYLAQGIARASILNNQTLTISLTGHLELCAGDKIEVLIPEQMSEQKRTLVWDPEFSGLYLIKNLNHQFTMSTPPSVYTVLDLVRDSYGSQEYESTIK